ncbi:hypothetical protein CRG98_020073 [Punica granatum]|uniref:Uncharacterized protein n=1 Tax=Punica granatum TaxID=22663 RepID=A0A2I0JTB5_PUNGR|nr:hypothetical protein CRG98_020073 [Punica granatum]
MILILSTIFALFGYLWIFCFKAPKGSPPSPIGLPLLGSLPFLDPELHTYFPDLVRRYGPLLRIMLENKCVIVVSSPSIARELAGPPRLVGRTLCGLRTGPKWRMLCKSEVGASVGAEFRQVVAEITSLLEKPNVSDFFPFLAQFDLQVIVKQMNGLVKRFDKIFETIIDQRPRVKK